MVVDECLQGHDNYQFIVGARHEIPADDESCNQYKVPADEGASFSLDFIMLLLPQNTVMLDQYISGPIVTYELQVKCLYMRQLLRYTCRKNVNRGRRNDVRRISCRRRVGSHTSIEREVVASSVGGR